MNVDKQSFGNNTEGQEKNNCIKNKYVEADTYHKNKEEKIKEYLEAEKELLDYLNEIVENAPEVPDEVIQRGIAKVHAMPYPNAEKETPVVPINEGRKKKWTAKRVLLIAAAVAILAALSISGLSVLGDNNELETENGAATYDDGSVRITFFGEDGEEYITVDTLLKDLDAHGYKDIMFPEAFLFDDTCKVSVPEYSYTNEIEQVSFYVYQGEKEFLFCISKNTSTRTRDFSDVDNGNTIVVNDICVYVFDYGNEYTSIEFAYKDYCCYISSSVSYQDMVSIANTIK